MSSGHDVADARLHRLASALRRAGLSVEFLGLGRAADGPAGVAVTATARPGPFGRGLLAFRYAFRARGAVCVAVDPDSLVAVRLVRLIRRRPVVADVHEDYSALLRDRTWSVGVVGAFSQKLVGIATRAAASSQLTIVADSHLAPHVARRRVVVTNQPDLTMLPSPGPRDDAPRAIYIGDVRESRGLWAMLDALDAAPLWTLDVVGPVRAEDRPELDRRLAGELGGRVRLHGRKPPAEAWAVARGAWCGFALLADTRAFREAIPSKLYEYLACGVPVIATGLHRSAELIRASGGGLVVPAGPQAGPAAGAILQAWSIDAEPRDELARRALRWSRESMTPEPFSDVARIIAGLAEH